jgi:hypothetical protein
MSFTKIKSLTLIVSGMCVKTHTEDGGKVFINICQTSDVPAPEDINEETLVKIWSSDDHSSFRIPMSIGEGHEEADKGTKTVALDVCLIKYCVALMSVIIIVS